MLLGMMVSAKVRNTPSEHKVAVSTGSLERELSVSAKAEGRGSSVSGGEFLMAALATCYCNDIFREAAALGISVSSVFVEAVGEFPAAGQPASSIEYRASVEADASAEEISRLLAHTDSVAEVHLTIRRGLDVRLVE